MTTTSRSDFDTGTLSGRWLPEQTADYRLAIITLKVEASLTGVRDYYAVINKGTMVPEGIAMEYPSAIRGLHNMQEALAEARKTPTGDGQSPAERLIAGLVPSGRGN